MKILIIGGSRFVGPIIVSMLVDKGHEVVLFNRGNIQSEYSDKIKFIKGDRNSGFDIKEHFDAVIDTCARSGSNIEQAIGQLDFDFFLHFSTIAVYKKTDKFPLTEDSPIGEWPLWGKRGMDKVDCETVLEKSGIKYASIRPVFILGPKNYVDRENFIYSRIKNGTHLTLPGNGEAIIQFVFAREVAESIALLATKKLTGIFNCAGNDTITLNKLVQEMGKIAGKNPIINYNPNTDGAKWVEKEFPFPNENVYSTNEKLRKLGIKFMPLVKGLTDDYNSYYKSLIQH